MDLHLNDWSLSCTTPLKEQWQVITRFGELARVLNTQGVDKIIFPTHYKNICIGGIAWKDCYTPSEIIASEKLSKDQCDELMILMDKVIRKHYPDEIDENKIFSGNNTFDACSTILGNAYYIDLPVVSLTFNSTFEQDILSGFWKDTHQTKFQKAIIKNLYDSAHINPLSLVSFNACKKMNPEEHPLWNQECIKKYLDSIGHRGDRKSPSYNEKVAYLRRHGAIIAELNGWKYNPRLSCKNSNHYKIRDIFYSKEFKHKDYYLCIDLEHEDFHFELCDHRGKHLGEIHHSGKVTPPSDQSHNIIV